MVLVSIAIRRLDTYTKAMQRVRRAFWLGMAVSSLSGVLFYTALRRSYSDWSQLNLINTALSIVVALLSVVAAGLFLAGVRVFKPELRRAYRLLCVGLVLFGLAQAQYPIASYVNAAFWYLDGFIAIPYLAAAVYIFWGIRRLAQLLGMQTRWASWWIVTAASVGTAGLVAVLPRAPSDFSFLQIAANNAFSTIDIVFMAFTVVMILRVRRIIARLYADALMWLAIGLGANALAGVHYVMINLLFARVSNWYFYDSMAMQGFFVAAILLVRAGYAMVLVGDQATAQVSAVEPGSSNSRQAALPIIDIVTYVAGLASKPSEIDPILDALREITARMSPGQALSPEQEQRLIGSYHALETYLTTKEPIRSFNILELRQTVAREFKLDATTRLFD